MASSVDSTGIKENEYGKVCQSHFEETIIFLSLYPFLFSFISHLIPIRVLEIKSCKLSYSQYVYTNTFHNTYFRRYVMVHYLDRIQYKIKWKGISVYIKGPTIWSVHMHCGWYLLERCIIIGQVHKIMP